MPGSTEAILPTRAPGKSPPGAAGTLLYSCPDAARLFLAGAARDHGSHAAQDVLFDTLLRHQDAVRHVDGFIATRGAAAHAALSRRVAERAPWISTAEVFDRHATPRAIRDFDRTECRRDAHGIGPRADRAQALQTTTDRFPPVPSACRNTRGLRVRGPVQAATAALLCAAWFPAARAASGDASGPLISASALPTLGSLRAPGHARLMVAAGSALALTGTTVWAGMSLWRDPEVPSAGATAEGTPTAGDEPATAALRYLSQHEGLDGENLLDSLLWRLTGNGRSSDGWRAEGGLTRSFAPGQADALMAIVGDEELSLDTWLADVLQPHPMAAAMQSAAASLHRPVRSAAASGGAQVTACRAIAPGSQSLASVAAAITGLTRTDALDQVPGRDLAAFAGCLTNLQASLRRRKDALTAQREGARWGIGDPVGLLAYTRQAGLQHLIERIARMMEQVRNARVHINRRVTSVG